MQNQTAIDTGTSELLCEVRDRVAIVTMNRPEARNALSDKLSPALRRMIAHCAAEPSIGALLITGSGKAFCAGGDVKSMGSGTSQPSPTFADRVELLRDRQRTLSGALYSLRKPTVAALPGAAAGAGMAIALACDIRIAAASAFMTTGYAKVGLSGDYGITWMLTRLCGPSKARELLFTSERIDAVRCEALGLVNRVVADDKLATLSFEAAKSLAQGPTAAYAAMKENLEFAETTDFQSSLDREAENLIRTSATADHAEAVRAFIEKQRPNFQGV